MTESASESRRAAVSVASHAHDADDCRALLDVLGLLGPLTGDRQRRASCSSSYSMGCRCDTCREAHRRRATLDRAKSAADPSRAERAMHGKVATYRNHGCRCRACSAANTADCKAYRARSRARRLADSVGAR